jgi:Brp/Blh family beta-carotene 15,15'-monooxygenase
MNHTMSQAPRHQRMVIMTSIIAAMLGLIMATPDILTQFWIALAPIALFGIAHGGIDPWLMNRLARIRRSTLSLWLGAYAALAGAFIGVVILQPELALVLFLLLSIWHFGRSDAPFQGFRRGSPAVWLSGSIPIIGPMFGHPGQTGQLFAWLIGADAHVVAEAVALIGPMLMLGWAAGFVILWRRSEGSRNHAGFIELLAVAGAMILLPPIIAFTFYFCAVHSTRHFLEILATSGTREGWSFLFRQAAPATLLAIALGIIAWWFLGSDRNLPDMTADAVRVLFWGLAALTVPHVMVVERWWAPKQASAGIRQPEA